MGGGRCVGPSKCSSTGRRIGEVHNELGVGTLDRTLSGPRGWGHTVRLDYRFNEDLTPVVRLSTVVLPTLLKPHFLESFRSIPPATELRSYLSRDKGVKLSVNDLWTRSRPDPDPDSLSFC